LELLLFRNVHHSNGYSLVVFLCPVYPGLFCDGTRRYGVPAPFFQSEENKLFVMYIINE